LQHARGKNIIFVGILERSIAAESFYWVRFHGANPF
jgi:hypothetical protein